MIDRDYCPACGRSITINGDLRFRKHFDIDGGDCPGGGLYAPEFAAGDDIRQLERLYDTPLVPRSNRRELSETGREMLALHPEHLVGRLTMQDIARQVGVSRERVRQIYAEFGLQHGGELVEYRKRARRLFHAVALVAKRSQTQAHGTMRRYGMGCHCDACKAAGTARMRKFREERGLASAYVCAVCQEPVWTNAHYSGGGWRHYRTVDHAPVPVLRKEVAA